MSKQRLILAIACALALAPLVGCEQDEIRRYQVARVETPRPRASAPDRMLGAIVPHDDRMWFFKLAGPKQTLEAHKEAFDRFVRSVHFEANGTIDWTVPEAWEKGADSENRYATFEVGSKDNRLELAVTQFPREGDMASVLMNVNRWRGQLGLAPVGEAELDSVTTRLELDGIAATVVDIIRPGTPSRPPAAAQPAREAGPRLPLTYTVPEGWKQQADPGPVSVLTFLIRDGSQQGRFTVSPLAGDADGLLTSVNLWRAEVGLDPTNEAGLRDQLQEFDVAGGRAPYVDLSGPESAGDKRKRILSVMLSRDEQTWFFVLRGPAALVGTQKDAFEAFVRSVKFDESPIQEPTN